VTVGSRPGLIVNGDWIRARLRDSSIAIIDARTRKFYEGKNVGRPRPGRIPGARRPVHRRRRLDENLQVSRLHPGDIRCRREAGASVVTYCHVGLQAISCTCGAPRRFKSGLYDLSFEWSWREEFPIEKD
jgi:3-mercaptopyruvate sulfurtransferase SseA